METTASRQGQTTAGNSKLQEFFVDQLQDIYWAEQKLVATLPKMEEAATSNELKHAFNSHLQETKNHVSRLEKVFDLIGEPADAKKCHAIAGIVEEGEDIIDETEVNTAQRDVGLIFAGQKVEHYEIATLIGGKYVAFIEALSPRIACCWPNIGRDAGGRKESRWQVDGNCGERYQRSGKGRNKRRLNKD